MSLDLESVTIQGATRVKDGAGGKTVSWVTEQPGFQATRNFYSKTSVRIIDQGAHNGQGPGVEEKREQFFKFEAPFPTLARDTYRLIAADGTIYRVLHVRQYEETMQVDVEVFS